MKLLLLLLLSAPPARAQWGGAEERAAAGLTARRAAISVIARQPLLELLAVRDKAGLPLAMGGVNFLATIVFDDNWNTWFSLKPAGGGLGAGAWEESGLALGAVYKYGGLELRLKETGGVVGIEGPGGEKAEVAVNGLFDRLYSESPKAVFGGAVSYAVFRNLAPLSGEEGTVSMRLGSDGQYYFSVTPDRRIEFFPRWLLAVDGVMYGLRVDGAELLFVSKPIELGGELPPVPEKVRR